jgi:excisionase family DNA binding protein
MSKNTDRAPIDTPWLSAEQTATYLAMPSVKAVYQAARCGKIRAYKFGKRVLFKREELDAAIERGRMLTPSDYGISSQS